MNNMDRKLYEDIGFIKGTLKEMGDDLKTLNGQVAENSKKLQRHEVILGKFGVVFTIIVFGVSTAINFIVSWIKDKF